MHMQGGPRGFVTFCNRMVVFGKVTTLLKFLGTIIGMKGQWPDSVWPKWGFALGSKQIMNLEIGQEYSIAKDSNADSGVIFKFL